MDIFLALFTYFAYVFIIVFYSVKAFKYLGLPVHLRWELYPVIHEKGFLYGGSKYESLNWWEEGRKQRSLRGFLFLLKEYLHLGEYYHRHRSYWFVLYPWHVGFILIITFHILCFFGGVLIVSGILISADSSSTIGILFYYTTLITGVVSFISGAFGSIGLFLKRSSDNDLKIYASPLNYFSYLFTFVVFLSGFYAWAFSDPTLAEYREFWVGLITLQYVGVMPATAIHIIIFDLFLVYLPFTRSFHYVTRFFAYFLIRWEDTPNVRGSELEKKLQEMFKQKITWSAPHIKPGQTWEEAAKDKN
jgi:nitrate reductase gamma subunit